MASTSRNNLSPQIARGMFGGPRGQKGNYLEGNIDQISGTTYGGQGLGWFWKDYPSVLGGMTKYAADATMPGSNMSVVNPDVSELAERSGMAPDSFGISN
jgi:hypothetical protein